MNIGITYDLRDAYLWAGYSEEETAEFDPLETIEALEGALHTLGHTCERIGHIQQLAARLVRGDRWDLVFNLAEGLYGRSREAQVPALLEAYGLPYTFSDPLVLALTLHKGMTKHLLRALGIPTPDFAIVETLAEVERLHLPLPLFVKPVAEGTSKGISAANKVCSLQELRAVCALLLARHGQPVLVETFLPGREFTVGIVGTGPQAQALGVMEIRLLPHAEPEVYSYTNKMYYAQRVRYRLAEDAVAARAAEVALQAWRGLGCRDGGRVDVRCTASGDPYVLELNPLAGLHPRHSDLPILCRLRGISYTELIDMLLASALARLPVSSCPGKTPALLACTGGKLG